MRGSGSFAPLPLGKGCFIISDIDIASAKPDLNWRLLIPVFSLSVLWSVNKYVENRQTVRFPESFSWLLFGLLIIYFILLAWSVKKESIRAELIERQPLITLGLGFILIWELVTHKLALLPLPFFPSPGAIVAVYVSDWKQLLICTAFSLRLLAIGFTIGFAVGLPTGLLMGWFPAFNYWAMPIIRFLGPVPASALIPIVLVAFPTSFQASIFLIALSTWFPVTVMTWSGVANVSKAFYEVARTLGADDTFLVTRVTIPAAMPSIFVGFFMGLGSAFATLVVGELLGVKAGLGWYMQWAQGWSEYMKVYAALIVMALMFSSIITLLFKIRDKVLVWQKGLIKW